MVTDGAATTTVARGHGGGERERALPRRRPPPRAAAAGALLDELFREHGRMVLGLCRVLLRDPDEAEDAAQQVFLSAHRALLRGSRPA